MTSGNVVHRAGSWGDDPLCVEQFVDDDKCCVIVTCAGNAELDDEESPCHGIEVNREN